MQYALQMMLRHRVNLFCFALCDSQQAVRQVHTIALVAVCHHALQAFTKPGEQESDTSPRGWCHACGLALPPDFRPQRCVGREV